MAKTLAQLRSEARYLFGQPDSANSAISESVLTGWANDGVRRVVMALEKYPLVQRDYTITDITKDLNALTIKIETARFKQQPLNEFVELTVLPYAEFVRRFPDYENDDTGIPEYLAEFNLQTVIIYPKVNTANSSQTLRIDAIEQPSPLSADADTPALPETLHDLIPHWMAYRAHSYIGNANDARSELITFNSMVKSERVLTNKFARGLDKWFFEDTDDNA